MNTYQRQPAPRRRKNRRKYMIRRAIALLVLAAFIALLVWLCSLLVSAFCKGSASRSETSAATTEQTTPATSTEAPETSTEPSAFFYLTEAERELVEQVVSAESRGEPYDGQRAVAQCILNACQKDGIRPEQALKKYKYTTARAEPTESVRRAVAAVFDRGDFVTEEPILYFYNSKLTTSDFHERQIFVVEIENHKFFKEAE